MIILGAMVLTVGACGTDEVSPPIDGPPAEATCTNEEVGYAVEYPADWQVNPGDTIPACSAFDPEPVTIPDSTEIPTDIAVVIRAEAAAFADVSDRTADPAVDVRDRQETTVDGRTAVVLDLEATGDGLHPEGLTTYRYVVDLDGQTSLIAETHDVDTTLPFDERQDVLDDIMASMTFAT